MPGIERGCMFIQPGFARFPAVSEFERYCELPMSSICPPSSAQHKMSSIRLSTSNRSDSDFPNLGIRPDATLPWMPCLKKSGNRSFDDWFFITIRPDSHPRGVVPTMLVPATQQPGEGPEAVLKFDPPPLVVQSGTARHPDNTDGELSNQLWV